jgi:hypothetical protein
VNEPVPIELPTMMETVVLPWSVLPVPEVVPVPETAVVSAVVLDDPELPLPDDPSTIVPANAPEVLAALLWLVSFVAGLPAPPELQPSIANSSAIPAKL